MFAKLSVIVTSVLITLAAATPARRTTVPPVNPPDTDLCCASVVPSSSSAASAVAAGLGLDLSGLDVLVGLSCSPITVLGNNCGGTETTCAAPPLEFGHLLAINCIIITT
ncbi:hydrophobin 2 [Mycena rebaudengoi]|nr:hydrophobin 2 [Mycena rebaudengoi]